jgi:hypothetical protein
LASILAYFGKSEVLFGSHCYYHATSNILSKSRHFIGELGYVQFRGKAGTIKQVHHILISELVAGVYPSYERGANAA